ncbi:MAG: hypothetical protein KGS61_10940, partial [Verrucomicrobia bacterium]|nr:hypothetical protein [Verrucomicrobiota bacterium]
TQNNPEIGLPNSSYMAETLIKGLFGWPNTWNLAGFTGPEGYMVETGQINYNGSGYGTIDGFTQGTMPGSPGKALNEGGYDNYAFEFLTVINFPKAGLYEMDVNSDDGFRVMIGNPKDAFPYVLDEANYGKGNSDVMGRFLITTPGLYPVRCLYEEGGGGNEVTWLMQHVVLGNHGVGALNSGVRSLLNDAADANGNPNDPTSLATYQYPILTTKGASYVKWFAPAPTGTWNASASVVPGAHADENNNITGMRPGPDTAIQAILVDGETPVDTSTVKLTLDGASVTPTVTKTGTNTTVYFKPASPLSDAPTNNVHRVLLSYGDRTLDWSFQVGTIATPTFFIDAADFNYGGGQSQAAASQMPYIGGAYAGLGATNGVDLSSAKDADNPFYRYPNSLEVPVSFANDRDRGLTAVQTDFRLGWIGSGQWYNYTRSFPAGNYNVYAAISYDGTSAHQLYSQLQTVSDPTSASPTLTTLGTFDAPGTHNQGGWGYSSMVPLTDASGKLVSVNLSGTQTLRYNLPNQSTNVVGGVTNIVYGGSGDWDYMVFVPVGGIVSGPQFSGIKVSGANLVITWSGGGTLQSATSASGPWAAVGGSPSSPATVPTSGSALYFRIQQ